VTSSLAPCTIEDFRSRVLAARDWDGGERLSDGFVLDPGTAPKHAAVLIAVVERAGEPHMILTQRVRGLRAHSGQVAFPGGRIDPDDASPEAAALRETWEEIGVPAAAFELLGRMPDYLTGSGYRITPVLATARQDIRYRINPAEVEAAFEVPLSFLMNPANHRRESAVLQGIGRSYWCMPWGDRYIWGVTARMIRAMYERLYA